MNQIKHVCGNLISNLTDIQKLIISGNEISTEKGNIGFFNYSDVSEFITSAGTFLLIHQKNKIPLWEGKISLNGELILEWKPIKLGRLDQTIQFKGKKGERYVHSSLGNDYTILNDDEDMVFSLRPQNSDGNQHIFFCIISRHYEIDFLFAAFIFKIVNDMAEKMDAYNSLCPVSV